LCAVPVSDTAARLLAPVMAKLRVAAATSPAFLGAGRGLASPGRAAVGSRCILNEGCAAALRSRCTARELRAAGASWQARAPLDRGRSHFHIAVTSLAQAVLAAYFCLEFDHHIAVALRAKHAAGVPRSFVPPASEQAVWWRLRPASWTPQQSGAAWSALCPRRASNLRS